MNRFSSVTTAVVTAAALLTLSACTQSAHTTQGAESGQSLAADTQTQLNIKTAFYPLAYLTKAIGTDLVSVTSLTPDGGEPHDLELSPQMVNSLGQADAVVYLSGFQQAVDEAIEHNSPKTVIDVSEAVQLVSASDNGNHVSDHDHDHSADAHEDHSAESGTHADHKNTDDDDKDSSLDPHFWLDPERMGQAATAIGQALAKADPQNAQHYTQNAASVTKAMTALANEMVEGTKTCKTRTFVTAHTAFGYLADRLNLTQIGISGLDPDSSPSPARLKEIADFVRAEGVTTIFTESLIDPQIAQTLASDLGISTASLDPIESQVDKNKDYADAMRSNLAAIRKALSCE